MRDKAAFLGGLGTCGRELCCTCLLDRFLPVTVAMARAQGLSIVPENISGPCGHLKCCLRYEYEDYLRQDGAAKQDGAGTGSQGHDGRATRPRPKGGQGESRQPS